MWSEVCEVFNTDVEDKMDEKNEQTNDEWLCSLTTEERADAISHLIFKKVGEFIRSRTVDNSMFTKEYWEKWLKEKHEE